MTTRDILIAARALVDTPEKWCQHAIAYTPEGFEVFWPSELDDGVSVSRCCAFGAIRAASRSGCKGADAANRALVRVVAGEGYDFKAAIDWNNARERTHAEVLAAFDVAIEAS